MKKIVLLCSEGLSTGVLVRKIEEAAISDGYDCQISAHSVIEAESCCKDADIVLLSPQVRFNLAEIRKKVSCPVAAIDMRVYGMMDGTAVFRQIKRVLDKE